MGNHELFIEVVPTMRNLLGQEDTDGDKLITVDDNGPKVLLHQFCPLGSVTRLIIYA